MNGGMVEPDPRRADRPRAARAPRLPATTVARPMRARIAAATVLVFLLTAAPAAAGDPILPLSQVHPGMRCTGYSVVKGVYISAFDVEVLDVVSGDPSEPGGRVLVRVSGPAIDATGVGPGFSGSPIYCDP